MPACTQITLTPVVVTSTGMTTTNTDGIVDLNTVTPAFTTTQSNASTAVTTANNAWSAVSGKNTVTYSTTAPGGSHAVGDTWFDSDDGYKIYQWNGTAWVAIQFGASALGDATITAQKLLDGAVSSLKLADDAVTAAKIAAGAVGSSELAAGSVIAGKIQAGSIATGDIAAGAITSEKITAGAIGATQIAANAISADKIAANAITSDKIAANAVTASAIAAGTITADKIATGAITATMITSGTMSADRISGGTIGSSDAIYSTSLIGNSSIYSFGTLGCYGTFVSNNDATFNAKVNVSGITTATGTNYAVIDSSGYLRKGASISSQRYKHDIVDLAEIPEMNPQLLLSLPVRAFHYNDDVLQADDSRFQTFMPGFIAEEVDAVYPIAVEYDEQGRPDAVNAPYLIPGMLALIQQQQQTITALEARIAALEARP